MRENNAEVKITVTEDSDVEQARVFLAMLTAELAQASNALEVHSMQHADGAAAAKAPALQSTIRDLNRMITRLCSRYPNMREGTGDNHIR